jgi:hypothetical protein
MNAMLSFTGTQISLKISSSTVELLNPGDDHVFIWTDGSFFPTISKVELLVQSGTRVQGYKGTNVLPP